VDKNERELARSVGLAKGNRAYELAKVAKGAGVGRARTAASGKEDGRDGGEFCAV